MSALLDLFKIKPFDIQPVLASWTDGPKFSGNRKKDPAVALWLDQLKAGCIERQVPEEYWYEVAEHFMGKKAKKRFSAVKKVLFEMNGENYRWTWKKFKLLMCSIDWDIDPNARVTVERKSSGAWWVIGKRKTEEPTLPSPNKHPRSMSQSEMTKVVKLKPPMRSQSSILPWTQPKDTKRTSAEVESRPKISKAHTIPATVTKADTKPIITKPDIKSLFTFGRTVQAEPELSNKLKDAMVQAPLWLFLACDVLESLSQDYPTAMSALSAVLIIAGSIPAIPAVTTGAAGALLASHAAQAVGATAVSLGTWLRTRQAGGAKASGSK